MADSRNKMSANWRRRIKDLADIYGPTVKDRAYQYGLLMRWHRPVGALLLLWPLLWALWIAAEGYPNAKVLVIFSAGVWLMRSAGCVLNDLADRKFDPHVERTKDRPLAAGRVRPLEALALAGVLLTVAAGLVMLTDRATILLAFGALFLAATYPFMKRYTYLPQPYLGAAFGWAIPMAYSAQTGAVPPMCWLLFLLSVLWATIYDTQYAMVDRDDDLKIGVKSSAILFGDLDRHIIGILQVVMLLGLALVGRQAELGLWYYLGLLAGAGVFIYQQWLIYDRNREKCMKAFQSNSTFGAVIFAGIALHYFSLN